MWNINSETFSNESVAIATQLSKFINDVVEKADNVIVFNLKEQDNKQSHKELVGDLCFLSRKRKHHSNMPR